MAAAKKIQVKALVNIRHNGDSFKVNESLKVTEDEAKELAERGCVEILEKQSKDSKSTNENENENEDAKGGE